MNIEATSSCSHSRKKWVGRWVPRSSKCWVSCIISDIWQKHTCDLHHKDWGNSHLPRHLHGPTWEGANVRWGWKIQFGNYLGVSKGVALKGVPCIYQAGATHWLGLTYNWGKLWKCWKVPFEGAQPAMDTFCYASLLRPKSQTSWLEPSTLGLWQFCE